MVYSLITSVNGRLPSIRCLTVVNRYILPLADQLSTSYWRHFGNWRRESFQHIIENVASHLITHYYFLQEGTRPIQDRNDLFGFLLSISHSRSEVLSIGFNHNNGRHSAAGKIRSYHLVAYNHHNQFLIWHA